jgi:hypothetical protein
MMGTCSFSDDFKRDAVAQITERGYLTARPAEGGPFDPNIVPDPTKIDMTAEGDFDVESALRWGNAICRWRRQARFDRHYMGEHDEPGTPHLIGPVDQEADSLSVFRKGNEAPIVVGRRNVRLEVDPISLERHHGRHDK